MTPPIRGNDPIDSLNQKTMSRVVSDYLWRDGLEPQEVAAVASVADQARGLPILDLGVGAGRTVTALREISQDYIGLDYVPEMVAQCRARFPDARFEHGDARSMPQFADNSFGLVMFACNGVSMVDHAGRLAILKEIYRLLRPGGSFIGSTPNLNRPGARAFLVLPAIRVSPNPVRLAKSLARFAVDTSFRLFNRARYKRREILTEEYAILNDLCHDYRTMIYYMTVENQRKQLQAIGFQNVRMFDLSGNEMRDDARDGTITFVVTK